MTNKILIGKIISAFGIKGEVKLVSYCQVPTKIEEYKLFDEKGNSLKVKISNKNKTIVGSSGSGDPILIASIDIIKDRNDAERMRGAEIFVNRNDLEETDSDEFYYIDLIGLDVLDVDNKKIGKVLNVQDFGGGGMLEIEFDKSNPSRNLEKIENFPFKNKTFPEVNLKAGFIRIELPEIEVVK